MEMQCSEVQSLLVPDDAIITDNHDIQVLNSHDDVIITEGEVTLVEEAPECDDAVRHPTTGADDMTMMAFVKFVQQPDGSLAPVGLVQAEEISDGGSIVTDPVMMETAEAFSRSALGGRTDQGETQEEQPVTGGGGDTAGPSAAAAPGTTTGSGTRAARRRAIDMTKPVPCELCGFRYKTKASLRTHQRLYHMNSEVVKTRDGLRCGEVGCNFTASHSKTFRNHLTQQHNIKMNIVKLIFRDWDEVTAWRRDFECETGARYRQYQRQVSAGGALLRLQLTCPGGSPAPHQRRAGWRCRRQAGHQGRTGRPCGPPAATRVSCTSFVRACRAERGGPVTVTVNTTHYGHTLDEPPTVARSKEPMPESNRRFLEESLRAGWSLERILRAARRSVLQDPVPSNAMFRLQRQHVYKVARRLGIPPDRFKVARPPAAEQFSALRSLADQYAETGEAHVLFHKEPGDIMDGVHESDFVFAFTTDKQLEQLHQLGTGVLMMDVTDAPRERPYRLLSLYAFCGDGDAPQPVAWLVSSAAGREMALELVHALRQLSVRLLDAELPTPRYFVAEKHSSFHQMWVEATGQRPLRLLDQTRVRAALSTMLIKHVEDTAERQEVWGAVSRLMTMTGREEQSEAVPPDEVSARRTVYRAAAHLARQLQARPTTKRFGAYLEDKWLRRGLIEEWQTVFRRGVRVPPRCAAQVYHAVVAAEYLTGTERRVDRAVAKLVEFSDKWHEPVPEKNASAPHTMAKFFPQSADVLCPSEGGGGAGAEPPPEGWGPPDQLRRELRLRMQGLINSLDGGGLSNSALLAWRRSVHLMEEAAAPR